MIKTQAYVITIMDNERSVAAAKRCIESANRYNIECHHFPAVTPKDNIYQKFKDEGINPSRFDEQYSRLENCMSAFFSHYSTWKKCVELNHEITVFEHDAVVVDRIPDFINFRGCINLGKPSYGKFKTPKKMGVNILTSKAYFPGAHAYRLTVSGAKALIKHAKDNAEPTDVFLRLENFPWLEEYNPWPVECKDSFSTIQHTKGCLAKHGYNKDYVIEEI
jgi:GR25 family glycosyltransferase involved in LPS biosynthesis